MAAGEHVNDIVMAVDGVVLIPDLRMLMQETCGGGEVEGLRFEDLQDLVIGTYMTSNDLIDHEVPAHLPGLVQVEVRYGIVLCYGYSICWMVLVWEGDILRTVPCVGMSHPTNALLQVVYEIESCEVGLDVVLAAAENMSDTEVGAADSQRLQLLLKCDVRMAVEGCGDVQMLR